MKLTEFWKCDDCAVVLEEVSLCRKDPGVGCVPHCCGKPMRKLKANTVDASHEKHLPVAECTADGTLVKVGSAAHPMMEAHYIEWIEVCCPECSRVCRQYLKPDDKPGALFCKDLKAGAVMRAYCNLHGLWSAEIK